MNIKGAVSPAALAIPSTTPVAIDLNAEGNVTFNIVVYILAPTPSEAYLNSFGTNFKPSSVVFITVGNINIERAMPPAKPLYILPNKIFVETIKA